MGLINTIKRWFNMLFRNDAEQEFGVKILASPQVDAVIAKCEKIYKGIPPWVDDDIRTINFSKSVCSEIARLTTLDIGVVFDEGERGQWLQRQFDGSYFDLRHWVEFAMAYGTVIMKPNDAGIDCFVPGEFEITSVNAKGNIDGAVFADRYTENGRHYTRLEYHRFVNGVYCISNRAFVNDSGRGKGDPVDLKDTKWNDLLPDVSIVRGENEPLDKPLFGVLTTPSANNVDINSPMGLPAFYDAIEELKDLDIAYSRNATEIKDSKRIVLADDRIMFRSGVSIKDKESGRIKPTVSLPDYVKNVSGTDAKEFYQEINPQLNTEIRITGIDNQLSIIGFKCGFSNGYFVLDQKTGMVTATQVEADDRRTIQLIKDCRDKLQNCLNDTIYAMSIMADLYGLAPAGEYEVTYSFGDITYSYEEDKQCWWKYVTQGKIPAWLYFVKFEKMSEDEAKAFVEEAQPKDDLYSRFAEE